MGVGALGGGGFGYPGNDRTVRHVGRRAEDHKERSSALPAGRGGAGHDDGWQGVWACASPHSRQGGLVVAEVAVLIPVPVAVPAVALAPVVASVPAPVPSPRSRSRS